MRKLRNFFQFLPVAQKLGLIVVLFVVIVGCLLALIEVEMDVLAGVRAYVGGEGFYSKGQKDAVHHLVRYAETRDERDFVQYRAAIAVPLGDRRARLELEKRQPDRRAVRDGFVQGRNHVEDVDAMARLFRRFRHVSYLERAIALWAEGDRYVGKLRRLGDRLHAEITTSPAPHPVRVAALLERVHLLNQRLTPLEDGFSRTLGEGARWMKVALRELTLAVTALLLGMGVLLSWMMLRHIREQEQRYRYLLDTANDAILVASLDGGIVLDANRKAEELLGIPLRELVGMGQQDVLEAPVASGDRHAHHRDGRAIPVEVSAGLTEVGGHAAVQSIVRDVTERRRAEQERTDLLAREQAARAEAELANRAKDEFLATLSHELRTPLSAILIWVRLLRGGKLDPESARRALEVIERNTKLQARLIEDLLEVSRIIAGKIHLECAPVDPATTVEAALEAVQAAAEAKAITLVVALDPEVGLVSADRHRLQQVVWNLTSNAIKFTPQGGRVEIELAREDRRARLTVRDSGIGIPASFLPHIFEPFRQADSSSTRVHGGLGLGLAIVNHLVERHGGTVAAESAGDGQGATFTVRLPLLAVQPDEDAWLGDVAHGAPASLPSLAGVHVLVVDDDADARESIQTALAQCEARVTVAGSAAEALAALAREQPAVVLCDIGMPGEDGFSLIGRLRASESGRGTPVAALTAYAREEDRRRALEAGFAAHLTKPIEPVELILTVAELVARGEHAPRPAPPRGG